MNEVSRSFLTVHVFGSKQCGKTLLKKQWFESSQARAISEVADIHIRVQNDCSYAVMDSIRELVSREGSTHHSFLILYCHDNQESVKYGQSVLDKIYTTFDYTTHINITCIENHFDKEFRPHLEKPVEFPLTSSQQDVLASRNPPQLWRAKVADSVQLSPILDTVLVKPLLQMLDHIAKEKFLSEACSKGRLQVVKLLVGTLQDVDTLHLIQWTLSSMDKHLSTHPISTSQDHTQSSREHTPVNQDRTHSSPDHTHSNGPLLQVGLLSVAQYLYHLDPSKAMDVVTRSVKQYPLASLHLLDHFMYGPHQPHTHKKEHLLFSGIKLTFVPVQWINHSYLTHINLDHNHLSLLPTELLQLSSLQMLNVSHNCIDSIPTILKWNCPKLKNFDLSHNRLVSKPYSILEGRKGRDQKLDGNPPSIGKQRQVLNAVQASLDLTGYNLYPCIRSLTRVNISQNPSLTQVPEWVCVLPSLMMLEMKGLPRVTRLTPHLAHCRSLCVLHLDTDHLLSPPPDLAQQGTRKILAHLRCQLRGSTPYRHIKLVLVGEKGVGKTTLLRQFVRGGSHSSSSSSPNMEVATFDYPSRLQVRKDRPRVTFHVVDFAGDEIYRCTHNCFLTYRSVYLCMWNITDGKSSLQRLCPWLHSIQASVPGSPVLIVATHADRRPGLAADTILQWEESVMGKAVKLRNKSISRGLGFPPILQSVVMDCLNKEDVELLLTDLYKIAFQLRHPKTNALLMADLYPRSYQALQALVEVKVRSLCLERRVPPVLRRDELIDYVHSLTVANPNGLEQDEEEFQLACLFLHEAGTIIHFKSHMSGITDLYFLDPQWLFNALANVVKACSNRSTTDTAIVKKEEWPQYLQDLHLPVAMHTSFLAMMERNNIIVTLDINKNEYVVPSLLPDNPPTDYPGYDLSRDLDNVIVQYVDLDFLPPPLFPQLVARVLLYTPQLSAQLLSLDLLGGGDWSSSTFDPNTSRLSTSSFLTRSESYHLDQLGYLSQDDLSVAGQTELERGRKIWGLSTANLTSCGTLSTRQQELTKKLLTITQPILNSSHSHEASPTSDYSSSHGDQFARYSFWKRGLFCEFPCGTKYWLEECSTALAVVVCGELIHRVKVLSYLLASIEALIDEYYAGLHLAFYSPCPSCLTRFWVHNTTAHNATGGVASHKDVAPQGVEPITVSALEQSCEVSINEFSERIIYLHKKPVLASPDHSLSFSGSKFHLSRSSSSSFSSPEPNPAHMSPTSDSELASRHDEQPDVALLDEHLILFPLEATVHQAIMSSTIPCPNCLARISLETISPHVLLVDFKDQLLLKAKYLNFTEDPASSLGKGGFGTVFRGEYRGEPVAVKVFRKSYRENVLLRRYKDLREELSIMSQLSHPRVVALVGVCLRPLAMVLKLAPLGTLRNHIDLCPHGMQSQVAHQALYQVADGIRYLHSLYIVHRDIKPSNILVWALSPSPHGWDVDVKLADYGVSQFYSPSGLHRHKGTEEYMAPELFKTNSNVVYDEKVDIFSFGLVLHAVVTGRRLFAGIINKQEQLRLLYQADFPQLTAALADALSDSRPISTSASTKFPAMLDQSGRHVAARVDIMTTCHSVCMQPLMENCLANSPQCRPTAQGLCSSLLLCLGPTSQKDYYISHYVSSASYCALEHLAVGLQKALPDCVILFPTATWQMRCVSTPYIGEKFSFVHVIGREVFLASQESRLLYSFNLPSLQYGHILPHPLEETPTCLFSFEGVAGAAICVGMTAAKLALFSNAKGSGHLLESSPLIRQILQHPDAGKLRVTCGVYHDRTLWCGCGRFLVGVHPQDLLMKHYTHLLKEDVTVSRIAASHGHLWISFQDSSLLLVTRTANPGSPQSIQCQSLLGRPANQALITDVIAGGNAVWAATNGGHLLGFDPLTADVLVVHRKEVIFTSLLGLSGQKLVAFGKGSMCLEDPEEENMVAMFTVLNSFITS